MTRPVLAAILGAVLSCSVRAAAGESPASGAEPATHDVMVTIGAGSTVHYLFDYPDGSFTGTAGLRVGLTRHLAVDGEMVRWSYRNVVAPSAGGGPDAGTYSGSVYRRSSWSVGANIIARTGGSRLSAWGGCGIGRYRLASSYSFAYSDRPEQSYSGSQAQVGVQFVGGLDGVVSRRLRAFAAVRVEVPYPRDFGSALPAFLAGVRVGL